MKKKLSLLVVLAALYTAPKASAQVNKNVVLEHFTNTRCGICASRNPGLFTNLDNNAEVLHLTIHPSRPYRTCVLHTHNATENDARTNYYGILGGTPRIVIQGEVISANTNYGSSSIFMPYQAQMSDVSVQVTTLKSDKDSLVGKIVITAEADNTLSVLQLYAPAVEDTVFYAAPNGEKQHYDVFRKVLREESVTIPSKKGDSVVLYTRVAQHTDWDPSQMYVMAVLQDKTTKAIEQAGVSTPIRIEEMEDETSSVKLLENTEYSFGPNPVSNELTVNLANNTGTIRLLDIHGNTIVQNRDTNQATLSLHHLTAGIYWLQIQTDQGFAVEKIIKQ